MVQANVRGFERASSTQETAVVQAVITRKYEPNKNRDESKRNFTQSKQNTSKTTAVCFDFQQKGVCTRAQCRFKHEKPREPEERVKQTPQKQVSSERKVSSSSISSPTKGCTKCGLENHKKQECRWKGKCGWCGRDSHKEALCREKKNGKPRHTLYALMANHL